MKTLQELYGSNFCNVIGKGDFEETRRWGDEVDIWGKLRKDLGDHLCRIWGVMKEKLSC
jgi:hypothetical protein